MKVAFPTNDDKSIFPHFGRVNHYLIYDTSTKEKRIIKNNHDEKLPAVLLKELNINEVVLLGAGENALKLLNKFGIKALKAEKTNIEENIKKIKELKEISKENHCNHDFKE